MAGSPYQRIMNLQAMLLMPATYKMAEADGRRRAMEQCTIVALAAERYRLKHGRWPEKLDDLQPFLRSIPIDPFGDGRPVKPKRMADGLVIYSLGRDREDNGGHLNRAKPLDKGDLGFQLWDVDKRRQPPKQEPPEAGGVER